MENVTLSRFLMVERHEGERVTVMVHHVSKPRLTVEFEPRFDRDGNITGGSLKRIRGENSWNGNYAKYNRLVGQAEKFFQRSLDAETPTHRFEI